MKKGVEYLFYIALLFMGACANIVTPSGGPKDTTPPIVLETTPNNPAINFNGNTIKIEFDEFVKITDIINQVVVSPFMNEMPEIKIKGKSVVINFNDTIKPNTTYSISFGKSISDITENNVFPTYRYVFSSGNSIDSLSLKGTVRNAFTLKPESSVLVMLYNNIGDSVPYKEMPFYITKTNDLGAFNFSNLKAGKYKIFSLKDVNSNYIYDQPTENIAYIDSLISPEFIEIPKIDTVKIDSIKVDSAKTDTINDTTKLEIPKIDSIKTQKSFMLNLFEEAPLVQKLLKSKAEKYGKLIFVFRKPVENLIIEPLTKDIPESWNLTEINKTKDTITLWLKNPDMDSLKLKISDNNEILDTIEIALAKKSVAKNTGKGKGRGENSKKILFKLNVSSGSTFGFYKPLLIDCQSPISECFFDKILLTENKDTVKPVFYFVDSIKRVVRSDFKWKEAADYSLLIPDSAFKNIFDATNDTLKIDFTTNSLKDYGNIKLNIISKVYDCNFIVQLITESDALIEQKIINPNEKVQFNYIIPGKYKLKVICDQNKNNIWDTGNYLKKIEPEKVFYNTSVISVKSNWDSDLDWVIE